jgi:hypothetical protein
MSTETGQKGFTFDDGAYRVWIAEHHDPDDYRDLDGLGDRDAAREIDELFADARDAGSVKPPAENPNLEIDVRASRSCILVLVRDCTNLEYPQLGSLPVEVKELIDPDEGCADNAVATVRCLVERASELLAEHEKAAATGFRLLTRN